MKKLSIYLLAVALFFSTVTHTTPGLKDIPEQASGWVNQQWQNFKHATTSMAQQSWRMVKGSVKNHPPKTLNGLHVDARLSKAYDQVQKEWHDARERYKAQDLNWAEKDAYLISELSTTLFYGSCAACSYMLWQNYVANNPANDTFENKLGWTAATVFLGLSAKRLWSMAR